MDVSILFLLHQHVNAECGVLVVDAFSFPSRNQVKLSSTPKKNRWRSLTGGSWFRVYVFACARLDDCFMQREIEDYDGFSKDMRCEEVVM